jgi:hypothetical protein
MRSAKALRSDEAAAKGFEIRALLLSVRREEFRSRALILLHQLRANREQRQALLAAIEAEDPELYAEVDHIESLRPLELKTPPNRFEAPKKAA